MCFWLPSLYLQSVQQFKSTTVVISPLLSLIDQQVSVLRNLGISVASLSSSSSDTVESIKENWPLFLYGTPESLTQPKILQLLREKMEQVHSLVIDECHLIQQCSKDFREEYSTLLKVKEALLAPVSCFTATPTKEVREMLGESLGLQNPIVKFPPLQKSRRKRKLISETESSGC